MLIMLLHPLARVTRLRTRISNLLCPELGGQTPKEVLESDDQWGHSYFYPLVPGPMYYWKQPLILIHTRTSERAMRMHFQRVASDVSLVCLHEAFLSCKAGWFLPVQDSMVMGSPCLLCCKVKSCTYLCGTHTTVLPGWSPNQLVYCQVASSVECLVGTQCLLLAGQRFWGRSSQTDLGECYLLVRCCCTCMLDQVDILLPSTFPRSGPPSACCLCPLRGRPLHCITWAPVSAGMAGGRPQKEGRD